MHLLGYGKLLETDDELKSYSAHREDEKKKNEYIK